MKVYFDSVDFRSSTGPNSFAKRLAIQLSLMGVTIADPSDYDVALVTIQPSCFLNKKKPYVVRLDGIWFKLEDFRSNKNADILTGYKESSAVIFQSKFDSQMITKWFGEKQNSHIIMNGISLKRVTEFSDAVLKIREEYEKVFVCSASWHPQKRLNDNIDLYKKIRDQNSCLIIMGGGDVKMDPDSVKDRIFYTGPQPQNVCLQVFAASDWMIHLAWLDHCPNTVIESLSQETPVICGNSGGTHEIIQNMNNGIVLSDAEYNFELMDYDNPPRFPMSDNLISSIDLTKRNINTSHLSIEECAQKYFDVLKEFA